MSIFLLSEFVLNTPLPALKKTATGVPAHYKHIQLYSNKPTTLIHQLTEHNVKLHNFCISSLYWAKGLLYD